MTSGGRGDQQLAGVGRRPQQHPVVAEVLRVGPRPVARRRGRSAPAHPTAAASRAGRRHEGALAAGALGHLVVALAPLLGGELPLEVSEEPLPPHVHSLGGARLRVSVAPSTGQSHANVIKSHQTALNARSRGHRHCCRRAARDRALDGRRGCRARGGGRGTASARRGAHPAGRRRRSGGSGLVGGGPAPRARHTPARGSGAPGSEGGRPRHAAPACGGRRAWCWGSGWSPAWLRARPWPLRAAPSWPGHPCPTPASRRCPIPVGALPRPARLRRPGTARPDATAAATPTTTATAAAGAGWVPGAPSCARNPTFGCSAQRPAGGRGRATG